MSNKSMMFGVVAILVVVAAIGVGVAVSNSDDPEEAAAQTAAEPSDSSMSGESDHSSPTDAALLEVQDLTLKEDDSEFGKILVDQEGRTIYIFEPDKKNESVCYGECADFWPPVLVTDEAQLGDGLSASTGVTERKDGKLQATYDGHPLYYVIGEEAGQVKCQAKDMHGGLWYVQAPDGEVITAS